MKAELNNVVSSSAVAMSNYNRLDAEYQKFVRQSSEWKARASQALDAGFFPREHGTVGSMTRLTDW